MKQLLAPCSLLLAFLFTSCDHPYLFAIDLDPIPDPVEVDICAFYVEITDPPFVTGYMEADPFQTDVKLIVGTHSIWITGFTALQIETTMDSLMELWKPQYSYKTYVNDQDTRLWAIIVDGTNDREQFYLGAQLRYNGYKHYLGWNTQAFTFCGALSQDEYADVTEHYPSMDIVNWRNTQYDSTFYISSAYAVLGHCKAGRWYANFQMNPYEIIDTIPIQFAAVGWESVLHIQNPDGTSDLRYYDKISWQALKVIARSGRQIITRA